MGASAAQFIGNENCAVASNANVVLASVPLPLIDVPSELRFRIRKFNPQISLELYEGTTQQSVRPTAHLIQLFLESDLVALCSQAIHQKRIHKCPHFLVPRPAEKLDDDLLLAILS